MTNRLAALAAALFLTLLLPAAIRAPALAAAARPREPLLQVKRVVAEAMGILADQRMALPDKQKRLRALADANFDFKQMARSALGSAWRSLSAAQRERFAAVFASYIENAYLNKLQNYSGQSIQIERATMPDADQAEVSGRIVESGQQPIALGFALWREAGTWKIYDILVENVSTLAGYRDEFQRILKQSGFDGLIAQIKQRDSQLASTLGSPTGLPF